MTVDAEENLAGMKLVKLFNLYASAGSSFKNNCTFEISHAAKLNQFKIKNENIDDLINFNFLR